MNNGTGLRVVLWLSGCGHHCKGCQNPQTWDPNSGIEFDDVAYYELLNELEKDYISGLTLSGGDPLFIDNIDMVLNLCKDVKRRIGKTIWLYTGYTYEEIMKDERRQILNHVDVLVDGRYEEDKRSPNLPWVGSSNQRVINVPQSLKERKVVLWTT
jgi:anaerobic ribonucleoside-triphosphate reductase activating protein